MKNIPTKSLGHMTFSNEIRKKFFKKKSYYQKYSQILHITNLLSFIGFYKFHAKSSFHRFIQKLHKFYVVINMNDIHTYSIF
jgi:hypothetical protein